MPVRRHFRPWDQPLLPQVVKFLSGDWPGTGSTLDLSAVLVVVPTKQAGRRLQEGAGRACRRTRNQGAVFPPRVLTPEALIAPVPGFRFAARSPSWPGPGRCRPPTAAACREVFPTDPPAQSLSWGAAGRGASCSAVEATHAELRLADVAWAGLAMICRRRPAGASSGKVERAYDARLACRNLRDAQADKIASLGRPPAASAGERIVLGRHG